MVWPLATSAVGESIVEDRLDKEEGGCEKKLSDRRSKDLTQAWPDSGTAQENREKKGIHCMRVRCFPMHQVPSTTAEDRYEKEIGFSIEAVEERGGKDNVKSDASS